VNRALAAALSGAAVVWGLLILLAPVAIHPSTSLGVTLSLSKGHAQTFPGPVAAAVTYGQASRICHQRSERSFRIAGNQMPVCARCAALYLSFAVAALAVWGFPPQRVRYSVRRVLFIAAVPTAVTWLLEHLLGVPMSNIVRAVAALPLGASAGWLLLGMLRYDSRLDGEQILYS
jgi:uncharacterized membrane protein